MHAESAVAPAHELFDERVVDLDLAVQHYQEFEIEDPFQLFQVSCAQAMEASARNSPQPALHQNASIGLSRDFEAVILGAVSAQYSE